MRITKQGKIDRRFRYYKKGIEEDMKTRITVDSHPKSAISPTQANGGLLLARAAHHVSILHGENNNE